MEVEDLIEKVVEESELSEEDLREKIDEKMDEFEGLVSEEGAVHLVAKEHGIELAEEASEDLKIENIVPDMRKVVVKGRVLNISDMNTFERDDDEEDGKVQNILLGDDTDTIRVTLWDEQTEIAENVDEGDVIEMAGCYTVEDDRGKAELRLGDSATVKMADDQDEFSDIENEASTSEVAVSEINTEGSNYRTKGMIMQVYTSNPFYRVDPDTGDTVREDDDGNYVTDDGDEVDEPEGRLAVSAVIDDGTDNIRCVFFGEQARELLDVDEETEKDMDVEAVEDAAEKTRGREVEVEGRTRYNDYFGRIELLVNEMDEIETKDEIENMLDILEA